jgi:Peptidase S46.
MRKPEKRERFTARRMKSKNRRMQILQRRGLPLKARAVTRIATFTLRLSYGTVRGYEQDGKQIPAFTDFAGLYQRATEHDNRPPFDLPKRWLDKKSDLNLATKFDFVSDADIIGGNSGSPW